MSSIKTEWRNKMEELKQLFLECKSHFNDTVKQAKPINDSQSVLKIFDF